MIYNNFLLLKTRKDFTQKLINSFLKRLSMFLLISPKEYPKLMKPKYMDDCRAQYKESTNEVWFATDKYCPTSEHYRFKRSLKKISEEIAPHTIKDFKYIYPLTDIYHELVHCIQFNFSRENYRFTNFIEATNECFVYIMTGQRNMDYAQESYSFWYICRYILNIKGGDFLILLRNAIVSPTFVHDYLTSNHAFLQFLHKNYSSNINRFLYGIIQPKSKEFEEEFWKELSALHNMIFYEW